MVISDSSEILQRKLWHKIVAPWQLSELSIDNCPSSGFALGIGMVISDNSSNAWFNYLSSSSVTILMCQTQELLLIHDEPVGWL